jgi:serine/threonine protein kinase
MPVIYAINEVTEENLAEVLHDRALTPEETGQITESLVAGLSAIHEQGLFHGQVNPANIWASGETVKLTSDCLQKVAPDARADSFAQDTGDLGATVFETLTQRKLTSPDDPAIEKLPVPFRSIVLSSITGRWRLGDIALALKKPGLEEFRHPVPTAEIEAKPRYAEAAPPKIVAAKAAATRPKPLATASAAAEKKTVAPVAVEPAVKGRRNSLLIFALIAFLAAAGVIWFFYRSQSASTPDANAAGPAAPPAPSEPAPSPMQGASSTSTSTSKSMSSMNSPANTRATASATGDHKIWRVVVYTFTNQSAAQHKVKTLIVAHPELKPEVFSASGHSPWLVTVGGPMEHDQAIQLRDQVRELGMPSDSYTQNYSH